jgi:hypothetical protein
VREKEDGKEERLRRFATYQEASYSQLSTVSLYNMQHPRSRTHTRPEVRKYLETSKASKRRMVNGHKCDRSESSRTTSMPFRDLKMSSSLSTFSGIYDTVIIIALSSIDIL